MINQAIMKSEILIILLFINISFCQITVIHPSEMAEFFKDGKIKATYAIYGEIPYASSTIAKIQNYKIKSFTPPYLACEKIDEGMDLFQQNLKGTSTTSAVIVDRGNCSFVTKTRNIQKIGGQIAIVVNNVDMDINDVFLADDGTGSDIVIPTLLISKKDGETIKAFIKDKTQEDKLVLSIDFSLKSSKTVSYDLFFSSDNLEMYKFITDFQSYFLKLQPYSNFKVHYVSYISDDYEPTKHKELDHCISAGKFCALPRFDLGIMDGRIIINENLRQKCIFNMAFTFDPFGKDYFKYIDGFYTNCLSSESKVFSESCSNKVIEDSLKHIEVSDVRDCVKKSYDGEINSNNSFIINNKMLQEDYEVEKRYNVQILPGIIVNGREIYGAIKAYNLFEAICGSLVESPSFCNNPKLLEIQENSNTGSSDLSTGAIILIILAVVVLNVIIVYFCKKYIVRKMHEKIESSEINGKINNVVSAYLALRDK